MLIKMVKIDSTKFGSITIDGKTHHEEDNYIISWDGEITGLHTAQRHLFDEPELEMILKRNPEMLIVGTGDSGLLKLSEEAKRKCKQNAIGLIYDISRKAIVKFNENVIKGKKVIAFIHVTC
jgi:hypothetical protein